MPGRGDPVRSHVDEPGPQHVRVMAVGWGRRAVSGVHHREAASSEVGDRMAVTCLIPPREEWSRRTPDQFGLSRPGLPPALPCVTPVTLRRPPSASR